MNRKGSKEGRTNSTYCSFFFVVMDLEQIERAIPSGAAAGDRYDAMQMAHLDSERSGDEGV